MAINVSVNTSTVPQYPLSYDTIQTQEGFYEPENRPDVLIFVTQASPNTGERAMLTVKGAKGLAYPSAGWSGHSFRRVNASIQLSS